MPDSIKGESTPKVDAVKLPPGYAGPGDAATRGGRITREFTPILGGPPIVRNEGTFSFLSVSILDAMCFPIGHPKQGSERYDWKDRGDGVLYGTKFPDE